MSSYEEKLWIKLEREFRDQGIVISINKGFPRSSDSVECIKILSNVIARAMKELTGTTVTTEALTIEPPTPEPPKTTKKTTKKKTSRKKKTEEAPPTPTDEIVLATKEELDKFMIDISSVFAEIVISTKGEDAYDAMSEAQYLEELNTWLKNQTGIAHDEFAKCTSRELESITKTLS